MVAAADSAISGREHKSCGSDLPRKRSAGVLGFGQDALGAGRVLGSSAHDGARDANLWAKCVGLAAGNGQLLFRRIY